MIDNNSIKKQGLAFAFGAIGKDMSFAYIMIGLMQHLTNSFAIGGLWLAFVPVIAKLLDAFTDPFVGLIIDKTKTHIGKFKPHILLGSILFTFIVVIYLELPHFDDNQLSFAVSVIFYILICASYSLMDVAFWALIPTFGSRTITREHMALMGRIGALIGYQSILIFVFALELEELPTVVPYIILAFFLISQTIVLMHVDDRSIKHNSSYKLSYGSFFNLLFKNDQLIVTAFIIFLVQFLSYTLLFACNLYFNSLNLEHFNYRFNNSIIIFIAQIIGFIAYMPLRKFYEGRTIFTATILILVMLIPALIVCINASSIVLVYIIVSIIAFSISILNVASTVMLANTVDYGEFKTNVRLEGLVFSLQTLSTKIAIAVSISFAFLLPQFDVLNIDAKLDTSYINIALMFITCLFILFLYLNQYKLSGPFYLHMLNTLGKLRKVQQKDELNYTSVRYAIDENLIILHENEQHIDIILDKLSQLLIQGHIINDLNTFREDLQQKLAINQCGIAQGIAIAHTQSVAVKRSALALAILNKGIDCQAIDQNPCDVIFLIASPANTDEHLTLLGKLSLLLNEEEFLESLRHAGSQAEILERIIQYENNLMQNEKND